MLSRTFQILAALVCLTVASSVTCAQNTAVVVGTRIYPKRGDAPITLDGKVIAEAYDLLSPTIVRQAQGDSLMVLSTKGEGSISRTEVVTEAEAVDYFSAAIESGVTGIHANFYRGIVFMDHGEADQAISDFGEVIRVQPSVAVHMRRGICWLSKSEIDMAISDFSAAIRLDPKHVNAYFHRGFAWRCKSENEKALVDLNEAIRLDPKHPFAYFHRSIVWGRNGDYKRVTSDLLMASQLEPTSALIFNSLGWLSATCADARFRDGRKAVEYATKACDLSDWKEPAYLDTLAAAYAEADDFHQAVETQQKAKDMVASSDKADFQTRLDLYRSGKPYREVPASGVATSVTQTTNRPTFSPAPAPAPSR